MENHQARTGTLARWFFVCKGSPRMIKHEKRSGIQIGTAMYETLKRCGNREEQGEIALALLEYAFEGEEITTNLNAQLIVAMSKPYFDKAERRWISQCENGNLGGAPKGNQNAVKKPKTTENNRKQPKTTENNSNDNDNDNENDNYNMNNIYMCI